MNRVLADGSGQPVRFVGFLEPGQKEIVSAGSYGSGTSARDMMLTHDGDQLSITRTADEVASQ